MKRELTVELKSVSHNGVARACFGIRQAMPGDSYLYDAGEFEIRVTEPEYDTLSYILKNGRPAYPALRLTLETIE